MEIPSSSFVVSSTSPAKEGSFSADIGPPSLKKTSAKRLFDVSAALFVFLLACPIIIFVVATLLLVQGRPIFIKHNRVGRGGRRFYCYKFRTMINGADRVIQRLIATDPAAQREWEATRKLKADPRVTAFGQVLRKSSIDELPQLLNIIRGDMSFVGPRPIVEDEIKFYGSHIPLYYSVRPGLTGPWQISGRNDISYGSRVQLDVDYVNNSSLPKDLMIMLKTVPAVLMSRGSY